MNKEAYWDYETLNKLHLVLQEILDEFVRICDKYNLTYFLVGGTYIGALRHSGFIPWDDDLDVGMPRKDYEKFLTIANEELNKKFFLDSYHTNPDFYLPFAKIKKNNTIIDEAYSHKLNNHKGIFIDIFPFDNVNKNNLSLKMRAVISKSINDTLAHKYQLIEFNKSLHPYISRILSIFSVKRLIKIQERLVKYCNDDNSKYLCDIAFGYGYQKELIERCHVIPTRKLTFAGKKYSCMKDDTYLKNIYGNYMEIPPKEKRKTHKPLSIDFGGENEWI